MPDLHDQIRSYARYATAVVEPVAPDDLTGGPPPHGRDRVVRWPLVLVAAAAAVIAVAVVLGTRSDVGPIDVIAQPPPTTVPTSVPPASGSLALPPQPGGETASSFAAAVRSAGIQGPRRRTEGGTAVKVTTVNGTSYWVVLPDALADIDRLSVVPMAFIGLRAH